MAAQPQDVDAEEEPFVRYMFGPEQVRLDEEGQHRIQTCVYEIHGDVENNITPEESYRRMMRKVKWRQRRIAAVVFGPNEIPVTPLPNPNTGSGPSFHTIQISDSWEPDYLVDLMVRDTNSYIVGFRRQKREEGIWRKGTWYRYSNETMPSWIQATDLRFDSSHGDSSQTKPGGELTIHEMFQVLSKFEDCNRDRKGNLLNAKDQVRLERALFIAIIMFSEATRFRSVLEAIEARIRNSEDSSELDSSCWVLIKKWEQASANIFELCGEDSAMEDEAPPFFRDLQVNLETVGDIIGAEGEFTLLLAPPGIAPAAEMEEMKKNLMEPTAQPIPDP